jgi:hypothetical protein
MTAPPAAAPPVARRLDLLDSVLVTFFLLGLYLGVAAEDYFDNPADLCSVGFRRPDPPVAPA